MWDLDEKSSVLNALPTNKTYGIINSLLAPLSVGGRVVMMDKFDPIKVGGSFSISIFLILVKLSVKCNFETKMIMITINF